MIPIITIEGATATGKSALAIELASQLGTEIISADSRQVYRYMDIGTAKVTKQEQEQITHHLVDIINPNETYNAGQFCTDAKAKIEVIRSKGMLPIICGGTGLYVRSLLSGLCSLAPIPYQIRQNLEQRLEEEGLAVLYHELCSIDPAAAAKISGNDPHRTLRALEVHQATGVTISEHWRRQSPISSYQAFRILLELPREQLYARIETRINIMLEQGLIEELKELFRKGYTVADPGIKCLGYKEFIPYLDGLCTLSEAASLASQHQRNLAKRQLTWYRKCTFNLTLDASNVSISEITTSLKEFLLR